MEPLPPEVVEQIKEIIDSTISQRSWDWRSIVTGGLGVLAGGLLSVAVLFIGEWLTRKRERDRKTRDERDLRLSVIAGIVGELSYNLGWLRHMSEALPQAISDPAKIFAGASTSHWNGVQELLTPAKITIPLQSRLRVLYISFERFNYLFGNCVDLLVGPSSFHHDAPQRVKLFLEMCNQSVKKLETRATRLSEELMDIDDGVKARLDEDILQEISKIPTSGKVTFGPAQPDSSPIED